MADVLAIRVNGVRKRFGPKAVLRGVDLEVGHGESVVIVGGGAAVVVGTIDEDPVQGMGVTRERKLAIARRSHALLTGKYGIPPEDIDAIFETFYQVADSGSGRRIARGRPAWSKVAVRS